MCSTKLHISPFEPSILVVEQDPDFAESDLVSALSSSKLSTFSPPDENWSLTQLSQLAMNTSFWFLPESALPGYTEEPAIEDNSRFVVAWRSFDYNNTITWQAGPRKTLARSTSVHASTQLKQSSPSVDLYLWSQGRKRKVILGDGNCLFRAVAHIVYGTQESHATVRRILVTFVSKNRPVLVKYVTNGSFEEHIRAVAREGPGELKLSCTLQQACTNYLYIFSHHTHHYRWLLIEPEQHTNLCYAENCAPPPQTNSIISHIELCHTGGDHFDCVLTLNNTLPTSPPQLDHTSSEHTSSDHTSSYIHIC